MTGRACCRQRKGPTGRRLDVEGVLCSSFMPAGWACRPHAWADWPSGVKTHPHQRRRHAGRAERVASNRIRTRHMRNLKRYYRRRAAGGNGNGHSDSADARRRAGRFARAGPRRDRCGERGPASRNVAGPDAAARTRSGLALLRSLDVEAAAWGIGCPPDRAR